MLLMAYGIVRLEHGLAGWELTAGAVGGGLLLVGLFTAIERRSSSPLVRLGVLRRGPMVRADLGALLSWGPSWDSSSS